ncbi:MAG: proline--tRNA ligase [Candidatus Aenigmarchaeota archaeon]|nr:proline--tRNA ligase [Candidatus Aenigmarchaeota archaeon]
MSEEMGISTKRDEDFSKWYLDVVRKGGFVDQRSPMKGFDVILPWGYAVWEMLQQRLDKNFKRHGVQNAYFPMFIPESLIKKEEKHFEGFKAEAFAITEAGGEKLEEKLFVRPTSETIMYHMYSLWIRSYKDLPLKINQWNNVIRFDTKGTKPLIRPREFLWQEGHTVHSTKEDAEKWLKIVVSMYKDMYQALAIEPLVLVRPKSDTFAGADYSIVFDTLLQDGKVSQGPGSHLLGQHFSKPFNIKFLDESGKEQYGWQTSWGTSIRQIGITICHHGDDKGAVLPPEVAPYQAVIVPILFKGKEKEVLEKAESVKEQLRQLGLRVHLDDREHSAGFKFNEWELRGVPLRIEIGPKDVAAGEVTAVSRLGQKDKIKISELSEAKALLENIQKEMAARSAKFLIDNIKDVHNMDDLKEKSKAGGFLRGNWCSSGECEASIKAESGHEIRGTLYGKEEKCFANCLWCGKPAKHVVYVAKAY